ncbi:MAG: sulfotransferase domain-containing protein [Acetobacterales bacterium]
MNEPPFPTVRAAAASQLLISAGLPKSGSTWLHNLQNALSEAAGWGRWQEVQQAFFPEHAWFPYVEDLRPVHLVGLLLPVLHGRSYCIKVHCPPHPAVLRLLGSGLARATYIFRDPRDCVLSCLEAGAQARAAGNPAGQAFAELDSMEKAVEFVAGFAEGAMLWAALPGVHFVRYESLLDAPFAEMQKMRAYLGLAVEDEALREIVGRFDGGRGVATFNKGGAGRFRAAFSTLEIARLNERFAQFMRTTGYPDDPAG